MLKNIFAPWSLVIYLSLLATYTFAEDTKPAPVLYFDLGQKDGWVPFRKAARTGALSVLKELSMALEAHSGVQFFENRCQ